MDPKYYLASQVYIYPSANSADSGADNSEENIRTITDKFAIANFVIKRRGDTSNPLGISYSNGGVYVKEGECCIRGYYIRITSDLLLSLEEMGLIVSQSYSVVLETVVDGVGHVRADSTALYGDNAGQLECRAVDCRAVLSSEVNPRTQLVLGEFKTDSTGQIVPDSVIDNKFKYSFIDSTTVLDQDSGQTIQEWTTNKINYVVTHLSQLNFYDSEESKKPSATFKIEKQGDSYHLVFYVSDKEKYDINDIEERTHVSTSDGTNDYGENGDSTTLARENHRHDKRYIRNSSALSDTSTQTVGTNLTVSRTMTSGSFQTSGTTFVASNDGSIKGANGTFNVDASGNLNKVTSIVCQGTITGTKVYNAVWNDVAELYKKDNPDEVVEPGTVIAKVKGKDTYAPATDDVRRLVVGVVSDSYGHLLGGDEGKTEEENLKIYYPIALSGRVYAKVLSGAEIEEGDLMFASAARGRASAYNKADRGTIIGKALESSDGTKDKILMQVMLG